MKTLSPNEPPSAVSIVDQIEDLRAELRGSLLTKEERAEAEARLNSLRSVVVALAEHQHARA